MTAVLPATAAAIISIALLSPCGSGLLHPQERISGLTIQVHNSSDQSKFTRSDIAAAELNGLFFGCAGRERQSVHAALQLLLQQLHT